MNMNPTQKLNVYSQNGRAGSRPLHNSKKPCTGCVQGFGVRRIILQGPGNYFFAANTLPACDFAREAAFLCTTPDFTALSIAET